jgi:hypothetical protein
MNPSKLIRLGLCLAFALGLAAAMTVQLSASGPLPPPCKPNQPACPDIPSK